MYIVCDELAKKKDTYIGQMWVEFAVQARERGKDSAC
jgi:hypothetical protein